MNTLVTMRKHILAPVLFIMTMFSGCVCSYDITFRVSGDSSNVKIEYYSDYTGEDVSDVDLLTGDWEKTEELVDWWEENCEEDDPTTEEDESLNYFCQEEDEEFEISLKAINRDFETRSITVEIYVNDELVEKKEDMSVEQGESVSVSYYIPDY